MARPSIIFLHGGPGFRDYLSPYFLKLKDSFDCIFYDQKRGPKVNVEDLVEELNEIVNKQKARPILLGHSWGGVLAVEYLKKYQDKAHSLILMSTGLNTSQWGIYNDELDELGLGDAPPEEIFLTPIERDLGKQLLDESWETFSEETFDSIFENYLKSYDLLRSLIEIKVPILNVFGEKDLRFSQKVTRSFRAYNENIIDVEIEGAGHFPFLEINNREKVISEIIKFIK